MMNLLPTLYIRDSKGKARQWSVTTDGAEVVVSHGLVDGKISEKRTKAKAKNIGKANATTPETQAISEAQSKWTFQKEREDYHEDIERAGLQLRPMLALDFLKVPHRVNWEHAYGQPKLDGLRLTVGNRIAICFQTREYLPYVAGSAFEMMTRKGEVYQVHHLQTECEILLNRVNELCDNRCIALDGEAYLHGLPLQQITSRAKKYKKGLTEELQFHLFDLVIPGMDFIERHAVLAEALMTCTCDINLMQLVEYVELHDEEHMYEMHGEYTVQGFEGLMIRHGSSEYGIAQRSPNLFKYKKFYDDEFKIIDVWEDDNGNAMFTCEIREGQKLTCDDHVSTARAEFGCTPKRTHVVRKEMLNQRDELIGSWITVKYQALTDDFIPQFPVGLALRECDDEGNALV